MRSVISFIAIVFFGALVTAQEDRNVIPIQGQLANQNGQPVAPASSVTVIFRLYRAPVSGVAIWEEAQPNISVNAGRFSVLLGSRNALPAHTNFNSTLYLGITVDDGNPQTTDVEMRPRQALVPVISASYAKEADKLDGYDWSVLFDGANLNTASISGTKLGDASITAAKIMPGSITSKQLANGTINGTNIAANTISSSNVLPGAIDVNALAQSVVEALNPAGAVTAFAGDVTQVPNGWLPCDGRPLSSSDPKYTRLYQAISNSWGRGTAHLGSTNDFNIPDLRGLFLRGVTPADVERGIDPDKNSRISMDTGELAGPRVGTLQADAFQGHAHEFHFTYAAAMGGGAAVNPTVFTTTAQLPPASTQGMVRSPASQEGFGAARASTETRPANAYVNYIIKL